MARSYFRRMVSPPSAAAMQPSRPITSLWKAARLDRLAGIGIGSRDAVLGFGGAHQDPTGHPARLAQQKAQSDAIADPRLERFPSSNRVVEIEHNGITLTQMQTGSEKAEEQEHKRERPGSTNAAIEEAAPVLAPRDRKQDTSANTAPDHEPIAPAPVPTPLRSRNKLDVDAGIRTTAEESSSLHIGKIEVQIVPPPRSSSRPAPSPKPSGRLARGYTLWTNSQP